MFVRTGIAGHSMLTDQYPPKVPGAGLDKTQKTAAVGDLLYAEDFCFGSKYYSSPREAAVSAACAASSSNPTFASSADNPVRRSFIRGISAPPAAAARR